MSTISAIFDPDSDGNLHLPVPPELRGMKLKVDARLEAADVSPGRAKAGLWTSLPGRFWMADDFDAPLDDFSEYMG